MGIEEEESVKSRLPEEDVTGFCLWLKDSLKHKVARVQLSNRLSATPAIVVGQMSSSMYMMMQMLQASGQMQGPDKPEMPKDLTLEINAAHPTIINLNTLRKAEPEFALDISKIFLDQVLTASGVPFDFKEGIGRKTSMVEQYLDEALESHTATRRSTSDPVDVPEAEIEPQESILKEASKIRS